MASISCTVEEDRKSALDRNTSSQLHIWPIMARTTEQLRGPYVNLSDCSQTHLVHVPKLLLAHQLAHPHLQAASEPAG